MKASRINPIVVLIVGTILCLISGIGIYTVLITGTQNRISDAQTRITSAGDVSIAAENGAKQDVAKATVQVAEARVQWSQRQAALMPPYDVSDRFRAWQQISYELEQYLGPAIERWVPRTGVTLLSDVSIAPPPPNPNSVTNAPLVIPIGSGNISVGGSFRSILTHVLRWNDFNRLVLINNLALQGSSPKMLGTYNASVIIFPQNEDKLGPAVAGAGSGGTSVFGGGGGGNSGMHGYSSGPVPGGPPQGPPPGTPGSPGYKGP